MTKTINFGIVAVAGICDTFMDGIRAVANARVVAVASRTLSKAENFATQYNIPTAYGSYEELYNDPKVDVVYIATPTGSHFKDVSDAINAKKHILCEKPLASNAKEIEILGNLARNSNLFLLEAIWTLFTEKTLIIEKWINEGKIGRPRLFTLFNSIDSSSDKTAWRWNDKSGGGGLVDNGIYPISYAHTFFGQKAPISHKSYCMKHTQNADEFQISLIEFDKDQIAVTESGLNLKPEYSLVLCGTEGTIKMPHPFYDTTVLEYYKCDSSGYHEFHECEIVEIPACPRFKAEIIEVCRCLNEGKLESDILPISRSIEIAKIMDSIRAECNIVFEDSQAKK